MKCNTTQWLSCGCWEIPLAAVRTLDITLTKIRKHRSYAKSQNISDTESDMACKNLDWLLSALSAQTAKTWRWPACAWSLTWHASNKIHYNLLAWTDVPQWEMYALISMRLDDTGVCIVPFALLWNPFHDLNRGILRKGCSPQGYVTLEERFCQLIFVTIFMTKGQYLILSTDCVVYMHMFWFS